MVFQVCEGCGGGKGGVGWRGGRGGFTMHEWKVVSLFSGGSSLVALSCGCSFTLSLCLA